MRVMRACKVIFVRPEKESCRRMVLQIESKKINSQVCSFPLFSELQG